jgi:3-hydroxybutyryl-CoA dehydratase
MSDVVRRSEPERIGGRNPSSFTTRGRTVTEADVVAFAGLTGDFHPQHVDAAWSQRSVFGERVAHGLLVLGLAAGLVDFDPEEVIALRGVRDAVFKRPVRLGDTIHVEGRAGEVAPTGIVPVSLRVLCGERLVARAVLEVVVAPAPVEPELEAECVPL